MKALNGGQQDLLPAGERIDEPPQWFRDALDNAPQDHFVAYRQTNLHYRQWRGPSADTPNIVLVHGGGAHARWYDFIAPLLTPIIMLFRSTCRAWAIAAGCRNITAKLWPRQS